MENREGKREQRTKEILKQRGAEVGKIREQIGAEVRGTKGANRSRTLGKIREKGAGKINGAKGAKGKIREQRTRENKGAQDWGK